MGGRMAIGENLLPEFDREMAGTRKMLERLPVERLDWKPHPKSGSLLWLARHLADLPSLGARTVTSDAFDATPGGQVVEPPFANAAELLATFDKNARDMRAAIASASDGELLKPWSLLSNGTVLFTAPKATVLRSFVMNHLIHHRAQLGMYLRMNDVPVPSLYGPPADESSPEL